MQKITPCLWFDDQAEEAVNFYTSVFRDSKVTSISRYDDAASKAAGRPKGSVMTVVFQLEGQDFMALNGGPVFTFTPAISLLVNCNTQKEIDDLWAKLTDGGEEVQCGWLRDRYGISWQIIPAVLGDMMSSNDSEKVARVTEAFLKMKKFDIAALQRAFEGR